MPNTTSSKVLINKITTKTVTQAIHSRLDAIFDAMVTQGANQATLLSLKTFKDQYDIVVSGTLPDVVAVLAFDGSIQTSDYFSLDVFHADESGSGSYQIENLLAQEQALSIDGPYVLQNGRTALIDHNLANTDAVSNAKKVFCAQPNGDLQQRNCLTSTTYGGGTVRLTISENDFRVLDD